MKTLTIVNAHYGFDGISNVATNYYIYQNHNEINMDFVLINEPTEYLKASLEQHRDKYFVLSNRNKNPIAYVFQLTKIIKAGRYNIVHVHGNSSTMAFELCAAMMAGVKVRIAHSHNTTCDHVILDKILRPFFNISYTHAFACGKEAGKWMFGNKDCKIVSNGVDLQKYEYNENVRKEMRQKHYLTGKLVLGHIGRFSLQKNHRKLITIFEEIYSHNNDSRLVLLGDGELREEIEKYCIEHQLPVMFIGNSNEVDKWVQAFDLMVFPSLFEGLPLCLVEAQAAGLDCFISNTISPQTRITPLVHFIDLDMSDKQWKEKILSTNLSNRKEDIVNIQSEIKKHHFDIKANCEDLLSYYKTLTK